MEFAVRFARFRHRISSSSGAMSWRSSVGFRVNAVSEVQIVTDLHRIAARAVRSSHVQARSARLAQWNGLRCHPVPMNERLTDTDDNLNNLLVCRCSMNTDIGVVIVSSALSLLGVLLGTGSTIFVQRSSVREMRIRSEAERLQAQRTEVKSAISAYLEVAQHLQTQLYAREHGREVTDIPVMVEQIWLAHAQVDVICSEKLREPLVQHASVLNEVARHEEKYSDWWAVLFPYKATLLDAIREELRWSHPLRTMDALDKSTAWLENYTSWLRQFEK